MADDQDLNEWELSEMRDLERKLLKYGERRQTEFARQREAQIQNDVLAEISQEFGLQPGEVQKALGTVGSQEEAEEASELYKQGLKDFIRQRLTAKAKKGAGNRMQDERGHFTSPAKEAQRRSIEANEREYQATVKELKQKVNKGHRLTDEEQSYLIGGISDWMRRGIRR